MTGHYTLRQARAIAFVQCPAGAGAPI